VAAPLTLALLPLGRSVLASPASGLLFAAALGAFRLRFFRDNPPALFLLAGLVGLVLWR
jgi:chromate transporter